MDRQKLLMIFGGAWLSAALLTWFLYSATTSSKQTKLVKVYAASRDLSAGTKLKKTDLKQIEVPERDAPKGVFTDEKALIERTLLFPVGANESLTQVKLASMGGIEGVSATIPPGKRAVSVQVTDSTSAAGLILPRSHVDVIFTRTGTMNEALSKVILEDVTVLSIGRVTELAATDPKAAAAAAATAPSTNSNTSRAVTLLVAATDAPKLELAKNNGKIGLVLRNPLDASMVAQEQPTYGDVLDPYLGARRQQMMKMNQGQNIPGMGNLVNDNKAWNQMTGLNAQATSPAAKKAAEKKKKEEEAAAKPAPKVVDVFRGEKHVQEVFEKN
jgi:pilus assembly protein CpaB